MTRREVIDMGGIRKMWAAVVLTCMASAQPACPNGGEQVAVQELAMSPRSLSLGGVLAPLEGFHAGEALAHPGGLGLMTRKEFSLTHTTLFQESSFDGMGLAWPTLRRGTFAGGYYRLRSGAAEARDETGEVTGSFQNEETMIRLGYGRRILRTLSVGSNLDWIKASLADSSHGFLAVNLGGSWQTARNWGLGVRASNIVALKQGETQDSLPFTLNLGGSYGLFQNRLHFSVDTEVIPSLVYRVSIDYLPMRMLAFSLGRNTEYTGFALRLSVKDYQFRFASNMHALGPVHQISIGAPFGRSMEAESPKAAQALYEKSRESVSAGQYAQALAALREASRYQQLPADQEDARRRLKELVRGGVDSIDGSDEISALLRRGVGFHMEGKPDMARAVFQTALSRQPASVPAKKLLAIMPKPGVRDYVDFRNAEFTEEDPVRLKLYKAEQHFHKREYDLALQACREALNLNPAEVLGYVRMGSIYWTMGMRDQAAQAWRQAIRIDPKHAEARKAREFMTQEGLR
ncbi:MAG: hypothetical protein WC728_02290 [Elusimicrobiota bacterium]